MVGHPMGLLEAMPLVMVDLAAAIGIDEVENIHVALGKMGLELLGAYAVVPVRIQVTEMGLVRGWRGHGVIVMPILVRCTGGQEQKRKIQNQKPKNKRHDILPGTSALRGAYIVALAFLNQHP